MKNLIRAVHSHDVRALLTRLGLIGAVEASELRCSLCAKVISVENFASITKKDGVLLVQCDDQSTHLVKQLTTVEEHSNA